MMATKLCIACEENERWLKPDGRYSDMCEGCHRDAEDNARLRLPTWHCKVCRQSKKKDQFRSNVRICKDCQAAADARKARSGDPKPYLTVKKGSLRVCKQCQIEKPLEAFQRSSAYYRTTCKECYELYEQGKIPNPRRGPNPLPNDYPSDVMPSRKELPRLLLVDRERGQVILCEVLSEIQSAGHPDVYPKRLDHTVEFYRQRGYRVVDAVEREFEAHHEPAAR